jgi:hypothetical protein
MGDLEIQMTISTLGNDINGNLLLFSILYLSINFINYLIELTKKGIPFQAFYQYSVVFLKISLNAALPPILTESEFYPLF